MATHSSRSRNSYFTWPLLLLLGAAATAVHSVRFGATASASRLPDLAGATWVGDLRRRRLNRAPAPVPTNEEDDEIVMAFCMMIFFFFFFFFFFFSLSSSGSVYAQLRTTTT